MDSDIPNETAQHRPLKGKGAGVAQVLCNKELLRYLVVGCFNTLFGYGCYVAFVALYQHILPIRYVALTVDLASISSTPIGVTVSFLTYKLLVFRTEGNYLREWLRCMLVYSAAALPGLFVLPVVTRLLLMVAALKTLAPYLAGAIVLGGTAVLTYFAHKKFSFASREKRLIPAATNAKHAAQ